MYLGLFGFFAGAVCGNFLMAAISWRTFNRALSGDQELQQKVAQA
jgi:uncharacterized membrane protein YoaK (UPF0700 family)